MNNWNVMKEKTDSILKVLHTILNAILNWGE